MSVHPPLEGQDAATSYDDVRGNLLISTYLSIFDTLPHREQVWWPGYFLASQEIETVDLKGSVLMWSPASYPPNETRSNVGIDYMTALVLDYDSGVPLEEIETAWAGYEYVIYTTAGHTPEFPRCRVIVRLSRHISVDEHRAFWRWLDSLADTCPGMVPTNLDARAASQPFHLATHIKGRKHYSNHHRGPRLDVDAILKAFPPGPGPMEAPNPLDVEDLRAIVPDTDAAACERALSTLAECVEQLRNCADRQGHPTELRVGSRIGRLVGAGRIPYDVARDSLVSVVEGWVGPHAATLESSLGWGASQTCNDRGIEEALRRAAAESAASRAAPNANATLNATVASSVDDVGPKRTATDDFAQAAGDIAAAKAREKVAFTPEEAAKHAAAGAEAEVRKADAAAKIKAARAHQERQAKAEAGAKASKKAATAADDDTWKKLSLDKFGAPEPTLANVAKVLRFDPRYSSLHRELFENQDLFDGKVVDDPMIYAIVEDVEDRYRLKAPTQTFHEALRLVANERATDRLIRMLDGIPAWDGLDRLSSFALDVYGDVRPIGNIVVRKWLIASIARAYAPGCPADLCMILVGGQGYGKSLSLRLLGGEGFFSDAGIPIGHDGDAMDALSGVWILELGEMAAMRKHSIEQMKSWASRTEDRGRCAYGRARETRLRRVVLAGTANPKIVLTDTTGNRRFGIVHVTKRVDTTKLAADRSQILAQAIVEYRAAPVPSTWLLSQGEIAMLSSANAPHEAIEDDPVLGAVKGWLLTREPVGDRSFLLSEAHESMRFLYPTERVPVALVRAALERLGCEDPGGRSSRHPTRACRKWWTRPLWLGIEEADVDLGDGLPQWASEENGDGATANGLELLERLRASKSAA